MATSFVKLSDAMGFLGKCESPIEIKLLGALNRFGVECQTQVQIGKYKADIFINSKYRKIIVECDGEEFHKDKQKDAIRDQYIEKKGYLVFRFTGSQIQRDSIDCAMEIIKNISEIYSSQKYQDFLEKYLKQEEQRTYNN